MASKNAGNDDIDELIPPDFATRKIKVKGTGVTMDDLMKGVSFEVENDTTANEAKELAELDEEGSTWWDKDDMLRYLESNERNVDNDDETDDRDPFEVKISKMELIAKAEDNEPLVYKRVIRHGNGPLITKDSDISYHATGYLEFADEPFDCSRMRKKPYLSRLNEDPLVRGLFLGLTTMRLHEKAEFILTPYAAFGELGCMPRIPGNAKILYVIEILKIFGEASLAPLENMTFEDRQAIPFADLMVKCNDERVCGNTFFKENRLREARSRYSTAIKVLEDRMLKDAEEEKQAQQLLLKLYYNSANVLNTLRKHYAAVNFCKRALAIDANCVKALFQYGKAAYNNGDYELCSKHLRRAQSLSPNSVAISELLANLDKRTKQDEAAQKDLFNRMGKMFN